jgi:molecular chaperone GrpE
MPTPSNEEQTVQPQENGPAETPAQSPDPVAELAKLTTERNELNDRMLRLAAEFENYKRRVRKESEEAGLRAIETLLKEILPPLDNLDRALVAARGKADGPSGLSTLGALVEGVQMVQKQFFTALERFQVKPFDVQPGQPFDPQIHEAVQQVDDAELPPGSVATVFQRGYKAGARLLRPAVVAVVRARPAPAAEPTSAAN